MVYFELLCIELVISIAVVTSCDAAKIEVNPIAVILLEFAVAGIFLVEKGVL